MCVGLEYQLMYCYMHLLMHFVSVSGTITNSAALLHEEGAREVYACCTHAVFRWVTEQNSDCTVQRL